MYVIESRRVAGFVNKTLHEMTKAQLADNRRFNSDENHEWYVVSAERAHRFVRYGGVHTTGLWVDQGRIRKAKGE